jgi:CheY-specific phosphatase CheX
MRANLDEKSIIAANSQFWEQMLAMKLEPMALRDDFSVGQGYAEGAVNLFGAWKGRIEVWMEDGLACHATAAMLMQARETVTEADTLDAAKEIANMIAGLVKSSLPRPCTMSVPEACVGRGECCKRRRGDDLLAVAFHHASGVMRVSVVEQECVEGGHSFPRSARSDVTD